MRSFEMCQILTSKFSQFFFGRRCSLFEYNEGLRSFSPAIVWQTHNRNFLDGWVAKQYALNLYRRNILTATNNHILQAIANLRVSAFVDHGHITRMKPTATHDFRRCLRISILALHYGVPPHDDLTERHAIMRDFSSGFINYAQFTRRQKLHSLACLDHRPLGACKSLIFRSRATNRNELGCLCMP